MLLNCSTSLKFVIIKLTTLKMEQVENKRPFKTQSLNSTKIIIGIFLTNEMQ